MSSLFLLSLFGFVIVSSFTEATRTLVLFDKLNDQTQYSQFLQQLQARGLELDIHTADEQTIVFQSYGVYQYQNVLLLCPETKTLAPFTLKELLAFLEYGGNVLMAGSSKLSKMQRQFAAECGVDVHKRGSQAIDHSNSIDNVQHTSILAPFIINSPVIVGKELAASQHDPILFDGVGQTISSDDILSVSLLNPSDSAYSSSIVKSKALPDDANFHGSRISLVSAVQARNNARFVFAGSVKMFTDASFETPNVANAKFCQAISKWTFGESGILRVTNVHHHRADGSKPEKMLKNIERPDQPVSLYPDAEIARDTLVYRIKDNLTYSFDVHEYRNGKWEPFAADDMQLEFVMLDPYVRKGMTHDNKGHFQVTFESPDAYGIFQFRVLYRRIGFSTVHLTTQVSLRPFKHDEYERFIPTAYPYYLSSFSMMAGVFIMSFFFLYSSE